MESNRPSRRELGADTFPVYVSVMSSLYIAGGGGGGGQSALLMIDRLDNGGALARLSVSRGRK